jgi:hypothetical protein
MLPDMKPIVLILAASATLALAACGDSRPAPSHEELRSSNQNAADQAEKSFDKENPADPAALK